MVQIFILVPVLHTIGIQCTYYTENLPYIQICVHYDMFYSCIICNTEEELNSWLLGKLSLKNYNPPWQSRAAHLVIAIIWLLSVSINFLYLGQSYVEISINRVLDDHYLCDSFPIFSLLLVQCCHRYLNIIGTQSNTQPYNTHSPKLKSTLPQSYISYWNIFWESCNFLLRTPPKDFFNFLFGQSDWPTKNFGHKKNVIQVINTHLPYM